MKKTSIYAALIAWLAAMTLPTEVHKVPKFEPFDFHTDDRHGLYTMLDMKKLDRHHVAAVLQRKSLKESGRQPSLLKRTIDCRSILANLKQARLDLDRGAQKSPLYDMAAAVCQASGKPDGNTREGDAIG
jgi:hypothetical protein